jgi:uncharacterized protein YcnI
LNVRIPTIGCAVAAAASLALAPTAVAHVTLNPGEWEADGFGRFDIRVPTERDNAATTAVSVQLPENVISVSFQPKPGWKREIKMTKLDKPVEVFGEQVTERVASVTWSGGRIRPGEFDEFGMSIRVPNTPGKELVFPATQTYSSGEVVRWIGPEEADEPAPRVAVTAAAAEEEAAPAPAAEEPAAAAEEGESNTLEIVALAFGVAGLLTAIAALAMRRGRTRVPAA